VEYIRRGAYGAVLTASHIGPTMPGASSGAGEESSVHVVVVGCGRVGSSLALSLQELGHTAAVIDKQATAFKRLPDAFTGPTITGVGFDRDRLIEAGIEEAGALAAVTNGDNSNIVVARVAKESFSVERVMARIYDPRRAAVYQRLGVATVATVAWTTDQALRRILPDVGAADWTDPSARVQVVERTAPVAWVGLRIAGLDEPGRFRLVALTRLGIAQVPNPDLVIQEGDLLHLAVATDVIEEMDQVLASDPKGRH
jgi:trk system potassium uptake protein